MAEDIALNRDEMIRLLAIGIAMERGHTMADVRPPMQPGPNTRSIAATLLDAYVVTRNQVDVGLPTYKQVGWMGPYGLIPSGMDNDPNPKWAPVYIEAPSA